MLYIIKFLKNTYDDKLCNNSYFLAVKTYKTQLRSIKTKAKLKQKQIKQN